MIYAEKPPIRIYLGIQGENLHREISINWDEWKKIYPEGKVSIYFQRPDREDCYPVIAESSDNPIIWSPDITAMSVSGDGKIVIRLIAGDVIAKSTTIYTKTSISPDFTEDAPDPWIDWIAKVEADALLVKNSTEITLEAKLAASLSEQNAKASEENALESEQNAKASEENIINNLTNLPIASKDVLGIVKVGENLLIEDGLLAVDVLENQDIENLINSYI